MKTTTAGIQTDLFSPEYQVTYSSIINPKQRLALDVKFNDKELIDKQIIKAQRKIIKSYLLGLNKSRLEAYKKTGRYLMLYNPNIFCDFQKYIENGQLLFAAIGIKQYTNNQTSLDTLVRIIKYLEK